MLKLFVSALFIFSVTLLHAEREYVNSIEEFYVHTENHVNNVNLLASMAYEKIRQNPEKFRKMFGIPEGIPLDKELKKEILKFMSRHDEAKLNTNRKFLDKHKVSRPVITYLYEDYGVYTRVHEEVKPTEGQANRPKPTENPFKVLLVNRVDDHVAIEQFKSMGIDQNHWKRKFFLDLEKFVDFIERGSNPVTHEEMGRVAYTESGSLKFKADKAKKEGAPDHVVNQMKDKAALAFELEVEYPVKALKYEDALSRYHKLLARIQIAGINPDHLDQFAVFELIKGYERKYGKILNPSDPNLSRRFERFFYHTPTGLKILESRVRPEMAEKYTLVLERKLKEEKARNPSSAIQHVVDPCQFDYSLIISH